MGSGAFFLCVSSAEVEISKGAVREGPGELSEDIVESVAEIVMVSDRSHGDTGTSRLVRTVVHL